MLKNESFKSNNLFNFHFSLLPKYRGCHTNFYQILNGEKISGVSLHKIDKGIDTGAILDQITFKIKLNDTAYQNYLRLMDYSFLLFLTKTLMKMTYYDYFDNVTYYYKQI